MVQETSVTTGPKPAEGETGLSTVALTDAKIALIDYNIKMAEKLVMTTMEEGIDYGELPGVQGKGLRDPGSQKIMNAFDCYPKHNILYHEESDQCISWALEAQMIHRGTQLVMGSGVGACSTREPKYKYRWVADPQNFGYAEVEIQGLKKKKAGDRTLYRVENPEYGEQVHNIFVMAAKRAEGDGCKSLPGVGSALRKLFDDKEGPRWTTFWNAMKNLLGEDQYLEKTHQMLGVKSMKDWLKTGKSLDDAIKVITQKLAKPQAAPKVQRRDPATVTEQEVNSGTSLVKICFDCFGWQPATVWSEANYANLRNFEEAGVETAWQVFLHLWDIYKDQHKPSK